MYDVVKTAEEKEFVLDIIRPGIGFIDSKELCISVQDNTSM